MKIYHCSDWHGQLSIDSEDCDIIICSGDLLPNKSRGKLEIEVPFQTDWVNKNIDKFVALIGSKRFLFCSGNHDFIDPCPILKNAGLNAININDSFVEIEDIKFFGFPWVPFIANEWNFELLDADLGLKTQSILGSIISQIDVLVCHCPPYGFRDSEGGRMFGNSYLSSLLYYGCEKWPRLILTGHLHGGFGTVEMPNGETRGQCIVSNAACGVIKLEI